MSVSKQIADFLEANKYNPRNEVIELMMKKFNLKKSSARQRYIDHNSSKRADNKKIVFDFLIANPNLIDEVESKKYAEMLGIPTSTYVCYKTQYRTASELKRYEAVTKWIKETPKYGEKYYKGRERQKFQFDDSKLFG